MKENLQFRAQIVCCSAFFMAAAIACGKDKNTGSELAADEQVVEIPFRATIGDEDFDCAKTYTLGDDSTLVEPKDFRYFVSDIRFVKADGSKVDLKLEQDGKWQTGRVALLDYATTEANCAKSSSPDGETRKIVRGVIKKGDYTGIEFALGLDDVTNHLDSSTAQPPLNNPGMWWSWKGGYKELRLELTVRSEGAVKDKDYLVHHGATSCSGNSPETYSCTHENNATISLSGDPLESGVKFDLAQYFSGERIQTDLGSSFGCMSFPGDKDCEILFANLGLVFKDASLGITPVQKAFSLYTYSETSKSTDPSSVKTDTSACTEDEKLKIGSSCFVRDEALNVTLEVGDSAHPSGAAGFSSHNAGLSCISCHQSKGPGKGLHTFSGTIYKKDQQTPVAGALVKIFDEAPPSAGADNRVPIKTFVTDKGGNFYSTTNYLNELSNSGKQYWVTVTDSDGSGAKKMMSPKVTGQCSQCHVGGQRIWIDK